MLRATAGFAMLVWVGAIASAAEAQEAQETDAAAAEADPDVERARVVFAEGVAAAQAGDYAAAAERFREALSIRPSPAVAFNLAQALAETGAEPEAWTICAEIVEAEDAPEPVREAAEQLRASLQERIGRLRITLGGSDDGTMAVHLDSSLERERLGREVAVAPGSHSVEAMRGEETVTSRQIDVPAGGVALVDLSVVATENVRIVEVEREREPEPEGDASALLWVAIGGGALVVAGVIVLVAVLASGGTEDPVAGNLPPGVLTWN